MKSHYLWGFAIMMSWLCSMLYPITSVYAEGEQILPGSLVNSDSEVVIPAGIEVSLLVIHDQIIMERSTTETELGGGFRFLNVPVGHNISYLVSATYEGVGYTRTVDSAELSDALEVTVYETTSNLEVLQLEAYILLIRGADKDNGNIFALELVSLRNEGNKTFVPDMTIGGMNFLRFSLLPNFEDLQVQYSLSDGQLITTDKGFGINNPVPPGSHEVAFNYQAPYEDGTLKFVRSFPLETDIFRLLVPDGLASVTNNEDLKEMEIASLPDGNYRVWEASQLVSGSQLIIKIRDLPQMPWYKQLEQHFTGNTYWRVGIPVILGCFFMAILLYAVLRRYLLADKSDQDKRWSDAMKYSDYYVLVQEIAILDDLFCEGGISEETYTNKRMLLKNRGLSLMAVAEQERLFGEIQDE